MLEQGPEGSVAGHPPASPPESPASSPEGTAPSEPRAGPASVDASAPLAGPASVDASVPLTAGFVDAPQEQAASKATQGRKRRTMPTNVRRSTNQARRQPREPLVLPRSRRPLCATLWSACRTAPPGRDLRCLAEAAGRTPASPGTRRASSQVREPARRNPKLFARCVRRSRVRRDRRGFVGPRCGSADFQRGRLCNDRVIESGAEQRRRGMRRGL